MYLGDTAAHRRIVLHLAQHVGQEHHLAVAGACDQGVLRVSSVLHDEARVGDAGLAAHALQIALPALAVGRIGEHEVELAGREGIGGERGAVLYIVSLSTLSLQDKVGFADGVRLRVQMWLLPPSLDELLPLNHPARFVAEFVDALDREGWSEIGVEIEGAPLGAPAYHPRALLSVWLYGFMTGMRSCRKLEAACRDQIPYLWLTDRTDRRKVQSAARIVVADCQLQLYPIRHILKPIS